MNEGSSEGPSAGSSEGSHERVERGARLVAAGIIVSRVLGVARMTVFAHFFGASGPADAYNAALRIPNVVRNLLGEGAISASFVPVYSAALERGDTRGARALANSLLGVMLAAASLLTALGIWAAPLLTSVFARSADPATAELTTRLLRVLFPMAGVMVASGWCLGVQNAHRRFFMAYASAALWSVAQIVVLLYAGPRSRDLVELAWWASWATLAGSVLQVAAQLPQVWRLLGGIKPSFSLRVQGLAATLRNYVPAVIAIGLFQFSSLIDLFIAARLPAGALTVLNYASVVYLLPLALFGVATAASALPELARLRARGDATAVLSGVSRAWERVLFYTVPSTVAFLGIGDVIVGLLYRTGNFGPEEQRVVAFVLAGYALGLVAYASARVLTSTFHAMQDYRTPLRAAATSIVVSAAGAFALALPFRESIDATAGIAAGGAAGAFVNLGMLWNSARTRLGTIDLRGPLRAVQRATVASIAALAVALLVRYALRDAPVRITAAAVIPAFSIVYLWLGIALRLDDATRLVQSIRRSLGGK